MHLKQRLPLLPSPFPRQIRLQFPPPRLRRQFLLHSLRSPPLNPKQLLKTCAHRVNDPLARARSSAATVVHRREKDLHLQRKLQLRLPARPVVPPVYREPSSAAGAALLLAVQPVLHLP